MKNNAKPVSLDQCRAIMNKNGIEYTDEELLKIRDFMYRVLEITTAHYERVQESKAKIIDINRNNSDHETKSISICPGEYGRTG